MMMIRRARPDTPEADPSDADRSMYDRRGSDRPEDDGAGSKRRRAARTFHWMGEFGSIGERVILILTLLGGLLGVRYISISKLDDRVTRLEQHQTLDSYLLCILARRDAPDATPPDCAPIIERGSRRQP